MAKPLWKNLFAGRTTVSSTPSPAPASAAVTLTADSTATIAPIRRYIDLTATISTGGSGAAVSAASNNTAVVDVAPISETIISGASGSWAVTNFGAPSSPGGTSPRGAAVKRVTETTASGLHYVDVVPSSAYDSVVGVTNRLCAEVRLKSGSARAGVSMLLLASGIGNQQGYWSLPDGGLFAHSGTATLTDAASISSDWCVLEIPCPTHTAAASMTVRLFGYIAGGATTYTGDAGEYIEIGDVWWEAAGNVTTSSGSAKVRARGVSQGSTTVTAGISSLTSSPLTLTVGTGSPAPAPAPASGVPFPAYTADFGVNALQTMAQPGYQVDSTDALVPFTLVRRVTNSSVYAGKPAGLGYSKQCAFSYNNQYAFLYNASPATIISIPTGDVVVSGFATPDGFNWSHKTAGRYFGCTVGTNPSIVTGLIGGGQSTLMSFTGSSGRFGWGEGIIAATTNHRAAFGVNEGSGLRIYVIDLGDPDAGVAAAVVSSKLFGGVFGGGVIDNFSISEKGNYVAVHVTTAFVDSVSGTSYAAGIHCFAASTFAASSFSSNSHGGGGSLLTDQQSHMCMAVDSAGIERMVMIGGTTYGLFSVRMDTGASRTEIAASKFGNTGHLCGVMHGYVLLSEHAWSPYAFESSKAYYEKILFAALDGTGGTYIVCQPHHAQDGVYSYEEQTNASCSRDGTVVLFNSTWETHGRTECYLARSA